MQCPKIGFRPEQAEMIVDVEIVARPRKQLLHERDLGVVLAQMGLHERVGIFARERAGGLQLRVGRGDRKARRDRIIEPSAPPPALDQRLALVVAALRRVGEGEPERCGPSNTCPRSSARRGARSRRRTHRRIPGEPCNRPPPSSSPGGTFHREKSALRRPHGRGPKTSALPRTCIFAASPAAARRRSRSPGSADSGCACR